MEKFKPNVIIKSSYKWESSGSEALERAAKGLEKSFLMIQFSILSANARAGHKMNDD